MSEDYLILHSAPTLAGIKTANLFTCPYDDRKALLDSLRELNRRLCGKGLRILPLRFSEKRALIYIYRPKRLQADLSDAQAAELLQHRGYDPESCEGCIVHLARKLQQRDDFPHEIGLFLGYPVEDVIGFMENRDCGCKCVGCWRVYGDEEAAQKKFAQFKKCTRVYCDRWAKHQDIERLTVAV